MRKNEVDAYWTALHRTGEIVRIGAILARPFLPLKSSVALDFIGVASDKRTFDYAKWGADETYGIIPEKTWLLFPPQSIDLPRKRVKVRLPKKKIPEE